MSRDLEKLTILQMARGGGWSCTRSERSCRQGGPHRTDLAWGPCVTCGRRPPPPTHREERLHPSRLSLGVDSSRPAHPQLAQYINPYDPRRLASGDDDEA